MRLVCKASGVVHGATVGGCIRGKEDNEALPTLFNEINLITPKNKQNYYFL